MIVFNAILQLVGSLGFLLYGMKLMSSGVQKSAGEKLQRALGALTGNRFMGLLTGLAITMIIQSSGATTVMVVSFVNAGLMSLFQSVGVIFGANIGTTITAWIVSIFGFNFKISAFAIPVFGFGFFLTLIKDNRSKSLGEAIMGFGLLFLGLSGLSDIFKFDASSLGFLQTIQNLGPLSLLIGFLLAVFITAMMHSSSAFTAIVITMAYNGIVTWEVSAAMAIGSCIGSTIDAVLACIGTTANGKRAALIHVMFNIFGTILGFIFFKPLLALVEFISPSDNITIRLSVLLTVFKTITTTICLPFAKQIAHLAEKIIKDDEVKQLKNYRLDFPEKISSKESTVGLIMRAEKEIANMADVVSDMFDIIQKGTVKRDEGFVQDEMTALKDYEDYCDQMQEQITQYLLKCEKHEVTDTQRSNLLLMIQIVDDLEAMSDECFSSGKLIQKSVDKKMEFNQDDLDSLVPYVELARQLLQFVHININKHLNEDKLAFAEELENQIDQYRKDLKKIARKRLEEGANVKAELLYMDLVRQIEKIGDHSYNISTILAQTL